LSKAGSDFCRKLLQAKIQVCSDQKNLLQEKSEFCGDQKILVCKQENPSLQAPSLWCGMQNPIARFEFVVLQAKIRLREPSFDEFCGDHKVLMRAKSEFAKIRFCGD
jgi:hypothetical protein